MQILISFINNMLNLIILLDKLYYIAYNIIQKERRLNG